ncbi:murein transglycosylase domain-containing protein [Marinospirillum alkaliphilum]|uniref:Membrane-bound lytic murein transglycosylase C n=1 Tax=Marinospirillum alkaliphilum DSM 21637 TaxID=1122209 RepID=A0A1K2A3H7_9GAMM|nr:murein transglycosylase domain-containing protein [Marinospirillum alkaliphilum]SFX81018.1 membrane-bound lytic murein transglycosylase C [Marinospirillum alkaliphilum DSM 21637]
MIDPISRRRVLLGLGGLAAGWSLQALGQSNGFEAYRQQHQAAFDGYREQLAKDFAAYQEAVNQAFADYRRSVKAVWGDEQLGSPSVWVEYSADMKTRTLVDFEQGRLTVEVIDAEGSTQVGRRIGATLQQVAEKRVADAWRDDALSQRLEQDATRISANTEQAQPDNRPVLADVLTGRPDPRPVEVQQAVNQAAAQGVGSRRYAPEAGMRIYSFSVPLNQAAISNKGDQFLPSVRRYAVEERIDPALVMAIMHSESSFNPMARSHIPAFGLMQIVPGSAGLDATEKVYGQQRLLTPSYLYNADNNIRMGCAYIHILYYRYLAAIDNQESRIYCTIAAYNTGSGNVARAFSDGRNVRTAAVQINRMTPQQVYARLVSHLPYEETRNYMTKVTPRYQAYQQQLG